MRGQVFDIDGTTFFTFGGAYSIDKMYRTEGISWFPEELPNYEEYEEGWHNLESCGFKVDYILSHSGPREIVAAIGYGEMWMMKWNLDSIFSVWRIIQSLRHGISVIFMRIQRWRICSFVSTMKS